MVTLGERAGPLSQLSPHQKVFHDSDPSYKLGVWIVLEGGVKLERSGPAPQESGRDKAKKKEAIIRDMGSLAQAAG